MQLMVTLNEQDIMKIITMYINHKFNKPIDNIDIELYPNSDSKLAINVEFKEEKDI